MAGNHMSELSPRQRMINMMYLVLTALLALNISKEVLEAFHKMDNSIGFSYSEKIEFTEKQYEAFELKALNNPEKLGFWNDVAHDVQKESNKLITVIDSIRLKIEDEAGKDEKGKLISLDDKEITIKILVKGKEDKGYGYGKLLKEARAQYRDFLLSLDSLGIYEGSDERYKINILSLFDTSDYVEEGDKRANPRSWEYQYYGHVPVAALAFMNQMKLDVGNMEGSVLELLQKKTGQSSITVNSQIGVVTAPRQTIMLGDSFHARVFIAGVDTNQLPKFNLYAYDNEGNRLDPTNVIDTLSVSGSQGIFSVKPKKQGTYWLGGDILVQSEEGEKKYEFKQPYRVDEAMSVISPDKMNVLYTEVVNPLSISVPGYSSDELQLYSDFSQCKIKRVKNGSYEAVIAKRQKGKNARKEVNLFIKDKSTGKLVGKRIKFRLKNVPPPIPSIKDIKGSGELSFIKLTTAKGIKAKLENFDFELEYEITSYRFRYPGSTGSLKSASYNGWKFTDVKALFEGLKSNQTVIFDEIYYKTKGSKSKPEKLNQSIVIKIN